MQFHILGAQKQNKKKTLSLHLLLCLSFPKQHAQTQTGTFPSYQPDPSFSEAHATCKKAIANTRTATNQGTGRGMAGLTRGLRVTLAGKNTRTSGKTDPFYVNDRKRCRRVKTILKTDAQAWTGAPWQDSLCTPVASDYQVLATNALTQSTTCNEEQTTVSWDTPFTFFEASVLLSEEIWTIS